MQTIFPAAGQTRRPLRAILLVSPGGLGQIVLRSLRAAGVQTWAVCEPAASVRFSRFLAGVLVCRKDWTSAPDAVVDAINARAKETPLDVVLASSVDSLAFLAAVRDRLTVPAFPMPALAILETLDNKQTFTTLCTTLGLPTPRTLCFAPGQEFDVARLRTEIGWPCVIKPVRLSGSDGVSVAYEEADLWRALDRDSHQHFFADGIMVQEYIAGEDVSLALFALDGTITHWAVYHNMGRRSSAQFLDRPDFLAPASAIIRHTGYSGVACLDGRLRKADGSIVLLECNPRFFRRLTACRECGLDLLHAGLAAMNLCSPHPGTSTLAGDTHLCFPDLLTARGIGSVLRGTYPRRRALAAWLELAADPLPRIIPKIVALKDRLTGAA